MAKRLLRRALSAPGLLRVMSGLAVFGLKYPSLLRFDRDARTDEVVRANLKRLFRQQFPLSERE